MGWWSCQVAESWKTLSLALLNFGTAVHVMERGCEIFPQPHRTPWPGMALIPLRAQLREEQETCGLAASQGVGAGAPQSHTTGKLFQQAPNGPRGTGGCCPKPHCAAVCGQEG